MAEEGRSGREGRKWQRREEVAEEGGSGRGGKTWQRKEKVAEQRLWMNKSKI